MTIRLALCAVMLAAPDVSASTTLAASAMRWDAMGHWTIAAIAYERLQPATRARVDALVRRHPDLDSLSRGLDLRTSDGSRELFMRASVWPDVVRRDPRFHDEADPASRPTPMLPGYPDMKRRASWHYMSQSFSTDGTTALALQHPGTVTHVAALARALGDSSVPASIRAYNLSWIAHVVGDLHQPLHGTSRASRALPQGDAGGNAVRVQIGPLPADSINLHAYWDRALSRANRDGSAVALARQLAVATPIAAESPEIRVPSGSALETTIGAWAAESATLARYLVYDIDERVAGAAPPRTTAAYDRLAIITARQRVTIAGYRLAALLEARLR